MNEVRRYDFKHAGPDNGIYYADARMIPCSTGKYVLSPDYDALVARVQAMKQERDVMSNSREALVEVVKELCQQLAEAQGRVLEVGELNVKLRDAEQQVVQLREALSYCQAYFDRRLDPLSNHPINIIQRALRETGA